MNVITLLYNSIIPGACGGIVLFLYGCKKGYYKNNKYKIKFSIEVIGALITSAIFSLLLKDLKESTKIFATFLIGFSWTGVLQITRKKITAIMATVIGEKLEE